jgi:hypothetical protein
VRAHPARCPRDEVGDLGNDSQVKDTPGQAQKSSELQLGCENESDASTASTC